jgi:hypothetical protein
MDVTILKREVRDWLKAKPGPITRKAKELEVSYFWLQRFMKGEIDNITTDRLQFLVERMQEEKSSKRRAS